MGVRPRRLSADEPVAKIVQYGEPIFSITYSCYLPIGVAVPIFVPLFAGIRVGKCARTMADRHANASCFLRVAADEKVSVVFAFCLAS